MGNRVKPLLSRLWPREKSILCTVLSTSTIRTVKWNVASFVSINNHRGALVGLTDSALNIPSLQSRGLGQNTKRHNQSITGSILVNDTDVYKAIMKVIHGVHNCFVTRERIVFWVYVINVNFDVMWIKVDKYHKLHYQNNLQHILQILRNSNKYML